MVPKAEKLRAVVGLTKKYEENVCLPESENKQETHSLRTQDQDGRWGAGRKAKSQEEGR